MSDEIPVVLVSGHKTHIPTYATEGAAGADLCACIPTEIQVGVGERVMVPTGIRLAIPTGWEAQVRPRSGLAWKKGLTVVNAPGTIDADYRGEVAVLLINLGQEAVNISPGERIAQMVFARAPQAQLQWVEALPKTHRGDGGFGSTGR
ncbi:MAG: dUTP diphosphatase [Spirochaetales bacterium]|nr:dUTP diphosphatase [Spirochaetales bacterium]